MGVAISEGFPLDFRDSDETVGRGPLFIRARSVFGPKTPSAPFTPSPLSPSAAWNFLISWAEDVGLIHLNSDKAGMAAIRVLIFF